MKKVANQLFLRVRCDHLTTSDCDQVNSYAQHRAYCS